MGMVFQSVVEAIGESSFHRRSRCGAKIHKSQGHQYLSGSLAAEQAQQPQPEEAEGGRWEWEKYVGAASPTFQIPTLQH